MRLSMRISFQINGKRTDLDVPWERTEHADKLKAAVGAAGTRR